MSYGRIELAPKSTPICHSVHRLSWFLGADPFFFSIIVFLQLWPHIPWFQNSIYYLPFLPYLPTKLMYSLTVQLSYPPTHLPTYPPFYLPSPYVMSTLRIWQKIQILQKPIIDISFILFQPLSSMQVLHFMRLPHTLKVPHTIQYLHMVYFLYLILLFNYFSLCFKIFSLWMHTLCPYVGIAILTQKISSYCEIICRYCTKNFMFIEMLCVEYKK